MLIENHGCRQGIASLGDRIAVEAVASVVDDLGPRDQGLRMLRWMSEMKLGSRPTRFAMVRKDMTAMRAARIQKSPLWKQARLQYLE